MSGANADELAKQVISSIKKAFGGNMEFELRSSWQGTSCDGQYQATEFGATLHKELNVKADPEFSAVIWDPSHWLNLAILDIRDDKIGQSGNFYEMLSTGQKIFMQCLTEEKCRVVQLQSPSPKVSS